MGALSRIAALALALAGCATVPPDRYGVRSVHIEGAKAMDHEALRNCLATTERPRASIPFGVTTAGACGQPPFDGRRYRLKLWSWPWSEWPLYDRIVLERDRARVVRWYEARGFHGARVAAVEVEPEAARRSDQIPEGAADPGCRRVGRKQGCTVDVTVRVEEGEPTRIAEVLLRGDEELPARLRARLAKAHRLAAGDRFDEAHYDRARVAMLAVLAGEGHAVARVEGRVLVDRPRREARIELDVEPGPACVFGEVLVEGGDDLPLTPIRAATRIQPGAPYRAAKLSDAENAVYELGAFSAVAVEPVLPEEGNVVDVRVKVTPARRQRWGIGAGVESGVTRRGDSAEQISVPEWDVHLIARYAHRNLFGGLRQLTIQERGRVIFQEPFPGIEVPRLGNRLSLELRQPGLFEPRLHLVVGASHDFGPDPFDTFFRHSIDSRIGLQRSFWQHRVFAALAIANNVYLVPEGETTEDGEPPPSDSILTFLEQRIRLDLRDRPQRTRSGFFAQVAVQEAGFFLPSSWDYARVLAEARFFVPLPAGITIAGRFAVGALFVTRADPALDETSQQLGPTELRLRGGGPSGNRGFLPGRLGDGVDGGTRRWEGSLELRVPITPNFGLAFFADVGDVSRQPVFRFDRVQLSVGGGLRYATILGVLRLDVAGRIPGAQVVGAEDPAGVDQVDFGLFSLPGAIHFSIGEPF